MGQIKQVQKRDGSIVKFDQSKITNAIYKATVAAESPDMKFAQKISDRVVKRLNISFENKIPNVEDIQDIVVEELLKENKKIARLYINYRMERAEIREKKKLLFGVYDDLKLDLNAVKVLSSRYLQKDASNRIIETPKQMFKRVAKYIADADSIYGDNRKESERIFYEMMSNLEFLPNSPTLMNAGTRLGQLSACFVLPIEDSLESIFTTLKNAALIHQSGGGTGFSFSRIRPRGDLVHSTMSIASGPISFMRIYDTMTETIKQGGRRRGANMGILRCDHPDIIEFINSKAEGKEGSLSNFNISVAATDKFMKAVKNDDEYELINPRTGEATKSISARDVFNLIAERAWESGDPGMIFIDQINRTHPLRKIGEIEATNPCVPKDTWILTSKGPRQVKDLINKKTVILLNGKTFISKSGFFSTGRKRLYKITTKEGFEIRATEDHPFRIVTKLTRYSLSSEWRELRDLKKGDMLLLNQARHSWKGLFSETEGYLVGHLFGDGYITGKKIRLCSWGESEGEKDVRALIQGYAKRLAQNKKDVGWRYRRGKCYELPLNELKLVLKEFNVSKSKEITEEMEKLSSSDFCIGFIRGMFDTDGSVQSSQSKGISVRLTQSNLDMLKAIQRMLLRLGIYSKIYRNRKKKELKYLPDGKGGYKHYKVKATHELVISDENLINFNEMIGFANTDKRSKLQKLIRNYRRRANKEAPIATILSIEEDSIEEVFDIQVPGINAFDGNGFILHNCGEQPLLPYESCNLGSLNLTKFILPDRSDFDWDRLEIAIQNAVHFLDNVIDVNSIPISEIDRVTKANRKIGLGVMGWADALIMLGIRYDSREALLMAEKLMKFIKQISYNTSVELAERRGSYPNFKFAIYPTKYKRLRNATLNTIAPTGSLSIIAGVSSGIEPLFAVTYYRQVLENVKLIEINKLFHSISIERGFYSRSLMEKIAHGFSIQKMSEIPKDVRELFVTAYDIEPIWHLKMQAAFQKYVDNAVSKTVNLPFDATVDDVQDIYLNAYNLGLKGITVYRYGSKRDQVIYLGKPRTEKEESKGRITVDSEFSACASGVCQL